jgi:threonine synthase
MVSDDEILAAYHYLATKEAVFVEPASAASVAGLFKLHAAGKVDKGLKIVCTVTGNGLKDPQWALQNASEPIIVPVDVDAAVKAIGL